MDPVRVLVVSDDPIARSGMSALLAGEPGLVLSGQVSGEEARAGAGAGARRAGAEVAIWDPGLGPAPELDAMREATGAGLPVVALASGEAQAAEGLTPREVEVLGLLSQGLSNKAIASRLGISEHTAKFHVNAILGKLGAESRAEAIVLAARQGLVVL